MEVLRNTSVDINGQNIQFDESGNPNIGYSLVEWIYKPSDIEFRTVGFYYEGELSLNKSLFKWHTKDSKVI